MCPRKSFIGVFTSANMLDNICIVGMVTDMLDLSGYC